jgi:hypothetical protein
VKCIANYRLHPAAGDRDLFVRNLRCQREKKKTWTSQAWALRTALIPDVLRFAGWPWRRLSDRNKVRFPRCLTKTIHSRMGDSWRRGSGVALSEGWLAQPDLLGLTLL